jgi:hypothetical protein
MFPDSLRIDLQYPCLPEEPAASGISISDVTALVRIILLVLDKDKVKTDNG